MTIKDICGGFNIAGEFISAEQIKCGIINTTYKVEVLRDGERKPYIIQKINKTVFIEPEKIMDNIVAVTEFIRKKIKATGISAKRFVLHYQKSKNGKNIYIDEDGEYWRAYRFIDKSVVYNSSEDLFVISEVGRVFGEFQLYLSDFDASTLYESIPNFHNTIKRYEDFFEAVEKDTAKRKDNAKEEIEYLKSRYSEATYLNKLQNEGKIPLRVTHNDTKCNNVVFDEETNKALAVLDLDTVMPGLVAYDIGDAARYICSAAKEDEADLSKVYFDLKKFTALSEGFLSEVHKTLTETEIDTLPQGIFCVTLELAMRFLTDYLKGDVYFHTDYAEHNLVRAKCQIALAKDIEKNKEEIINIVKNYSQK